MQRPRSGLFGFFAILQLKPHATDDGAASTHDAVSPSGGHFLAAKPPFSLGRILKRPYLMGCAWRRIRARSIDTTLDTMFSAHRGRGAVAWPFSKKLCREQSSQ